MKKKEVILLSAPNEPTHEKLKKAKSKSPALLATKTRQTYLQNLEKKLDEIMTASADQKKLDKRGTLSSGIPQNMGLNKHAGASQSQVGFGTLVRKALFSLHLEF